MMGDISPTTFNDADRRFMARAIALAKRGQGRVEPNPMVGAVLVRDGRVIAEGYHRRFGEPHAEVEALSTLYQQGVDAAHPGGCAKDVTMYVTLEPCCHRGKTPPCVEAIIAAGVQRVVAAMEDPFTQVRGQGLQRLREAGVIVEVGLYEPEAKRLNEPYIKQLATGLPWIIGKWASSLDGRIATRIGDSRWISNDASRHKVHQLRARVDAIMVGIGTVLADNPRLTARGKGLAIKRVARKVVIDPRLAIPLESLLLEANTSSNSKISNEDSKLPGQPSKKLQGSRPGQFPGHLPGGVIVAVNQEVYSQRPDRVDELQKRGVEVIALPRISPAVLTDSPTALQFQSCDSSITTGSRLDLTPLLHHLAKVHHTTNVLVEGGGRLMGSLIQQDLLDQLLVFIAPRLIGDSQAVPAVAGLCPQTVAEARSLHLSAVKRLGEDVMLDYRLIRSPMI